jgi:hypothetical protein
VAEAITILQNSTKQRPSLEDMHATMRRIEQRIEARIAKIGLRINTHTTQATEILNNGFKDHAI